MGRAEPLRDGPVWEEAPIERRWEPAQHGFMVRLLVLCRDPYHLSLEEAQEWLRGELEAVVRRDGLDGATLTRLRDPSSAWARDFDWLVEFRLNESLYAAALGRGGACAELLADLRLLGMAPAVALADSGEAIQLEPS